MSDLIDDDDILDPFDVAFNDWYNSEETQRRFHCGHYDDRQMIMAGAYWAKAFLNKNKTLLT